MHTISFETTFLIKSLLSIVACVLGILLWFFYQNLSSVLEKNKSITVFTLITLTRVIPFIIVFIVLKQEPRGDIPFFFYKAQHAMHLDMVYRDFWSYHAPIFSYILAIPLLIVNKASSIVALMMVGEVICVLLSYRYYSKIDANSYQKLLHYLIMPAPVIICLLGGQEDIWLWGFALWGLVVLVRSGNEFYLGLIIALALLCLKATFVFFLFPIFFLLRRKISFLLALALVGLPALILLYSLVGWDFLMLIKHTEDPYNPNLFSVLRPLFPTVLSVSKANWIGLVVFLCINTTVGFLMRNKPIQQAYPLLFTLTFCLMQLFLPSAMAYYIFIYLIVVVMELWEIQTLKFYLFLLIINLLLVIQPYWSVVQLHNPVFLSFEMLGSKKYALEYAMQSLFVGSLIFICFRTYQKLSNLA